MDATTDDPRHPGEIEMQRSAAAEARMAEAGRRFIRDYMPDQHREFFAQLPFIILGTIDGSGDPWATVLVGAPGFMASPDPRTLRIGTLPDRADPAALGLFDGAPVGLLGIEPPTRRRNRMNGRAGDIGPGGFTVAVEMSFGNCPQYILTRAPEQVAQAASGPVERLAALDGEARAMIRSADVFYVATYADAPAGRQADASHRGGRPGFVRIGRDGALTIPDFAGNLFFNTLGNIRITGRAGLTFLDHATGDLLQMTGAAEITLDAPEIAAFRGAERLWTFRPAHILRRRAALPLRFAGGEASPNSLLTGSWEEAEARLSAEADRRRWRPVSVTEIVEESATIRSLTLSPEDGGGLPGWKPGQHLPIRLDAAGETLQRTYTLSSAPSDARWRISVKREGRASCALHEAKVGDRLVARAPDGAFLFDTAERRSAVLIGAGIGITPMIAMLREAVWEGQRNRRTRPVTLIHAARTREERAFDEEIATLAATAPEAVKIVRVLSRPGPKDEKGKDHVGRVDVALLKRVLGFDDHDFFLCGPAGLVQGLYDALRDLRIPDDRIHAENFGPSGLVRRVEANAVAAVEVASDPVAVAFATSGKEADWHPEAGTLLDLAEASGLAPESSCRSGSCGTCRTRVIEGAVAYPVPPAYPLGEGEALLCVGRPAAGAAKLLLDL